MENGSKGASKRVQDLLLARYIEPARRRGQKTIRIVAGDIVRELRLRDRAPQVCAAMQGVRFLKRNQLEILEREGPPSGQSTTVAITYALDGGAARGEALFESLRGILREAYAAEGGAERVIRRERAAFDRDFERRQRLMHP
ncbi:MAG: hypothetical protein ACRD04_11870 [Terriglobales bacterium]